MTTIRQIQSLFSDGQHGKLIADLSQYRADLPMELVDALGGSTTAAAAMAAIRLQELNQQRTTLYRALIARLIGGQESNGGWGDALVTSLVIRTLIADPDGRAAAIRGIILLAGIQRDDGSVSRDLVRRLPGDAVATAFVLAHLSRNPEFAARFRVEAAIYSLTAARPTIAVALLPLVKLAVQRASGSVGGQAHKLMQLAMAS